MLENNRRRRTRILLILLILLALLALCGLLYVLQAVTRTPEKRPVLAEPAGVELEFQGLGGSWGTTMENPADVAYDGDNRIYVTVPSVNRIVYFDRNGKNGQLFVEDKYEPNRMATDFDIVAPIGIDVGDDGLVYVADSEKMAVVVFSPEGERLRELPVMGAKYVEVAGDRVYVLTELHKLVVLDTEGNLLGEWGTEGRGPDQLKDPSGVTIDADGNIYLTDLNNYRVISLDPELEIRWRYGGPAATIEEQASRVLGGPTGITIGGDGNLYVCDTLSGVLQVLTTEGESISSPLGSMGNADDQFYYQRGIDLIEEDIFVIADTAHDRIVGVRVTPQKDEKAEE